MLPATDEAGAKARCWAAIARAGAPGVAASAAVHVWARSRDVGSVGIAHDPSVRTHAGPASHPEAPERTEAIVAALEASGLYSALHRVACDVPVDMGLVKAVHTKSLIRTVESLRGDGPSASGRGPTGISYNVSEDTYDTSGTTNAARLSAGAVAECVRAVVGPSPACRSAFAVVRPPGHHACMDKAGGFCFFNNVAVAARMAQRELGVARVAIVDWDVHHGNGTQDVFRDDPSVLFISLHRHNNGAFFPGTGHPERTGRGKGVGHCVNIAWNCAGVGDDGYRAAFASVVLPVLREFAPGLVLVSAGFDAVAGDPLGGMKVSPAMFGWMTSQLCSVGTGRVVLALEGGYNVGAISRCAVSCIDALLTAAGMTGRPEGWTRVTNVAVGGGGDGDGDAGAGEGDDLEAVVGRLSQSEADTIRTTLRLHMANWPSLRKLPTPLVAVMRQPPPTLTCRHYTVMHLRSGRVLAHDHGDDPVPVASLAKIMSAIVALEACENGLVSPSDIVVVPERATGLKGTTAGLHTGDKLTLLDLLHGVMLPSGNDAANVVAEHVGAALQPPASDCDWQPYTSGPSYTADWARDDAMSSFVHAMNQRARELGLANTSFRNPHGLTHAGQRSTSNDVAAMLRCAWRLPALRAIVTCRVRKASITRDGKVKVVRWANTNKNLGRRVGAAMVLGGKTGVTIGKGGAGSCLANVVSMSPDAVPAAVSTATGGAGAGPPAGDADAGCAPAAAHGGAGGGVSAGAAVDGGGGGGDHALVVVTLASRNKSLRFVDNHKLALWGLALAELGDAA